VVTELQRNMRVCAATGRAWFNSKEIIRKLGLYDPCIVSGGAQIIEPESEKTLWQKAMGQPQVESIMTVARQFPYKMSFSDDEIAGPAERKLIQGLERIIYILSVSRKDTDVILGQIRQIPAITAYETKSWTPDHCVFSAELRN
jgi:hydroxymethylpyrimidine pyrophosphatase-like HAD family hydrolase